MMKGSAPHTSPGKNKKNFKREAIRIAIALAGAGAILLLALCCFFANFPRPYRKTVEGSGLPPALVYAVIKAESGFREDAESGAGAVGLMQLLPSTAAFVCEREKLLFESERLKEGDYNIVLGCRYLAYLLDKFPSVETALCAYNAGEGVVSEWLRDEKLSEDGVTLKTVPYAETAAYLKKIKKFRKIYEFLYQYRLTFEKE